MEMLKSISLGTCICGNHKAPNYPYRIYDKIYDCKNKKWINNSLYERIIIDTKIKIRNKILDLILDEGF